MEYAQFTPTLLIIRTLEFLAHIFLLTSVMNKKISKRDYILTTLLILSLYQISTIIVPEQFKFIMVYIIVVLSLKLITKINIYQIMIGYLITTVIIVLIDMVSRVVFLYLLDVDKMKNIEEIEYYFGIMLVNILIFIAGLSIKYFKMTFTNIEGNLKDIGIAFNSLVTLLFIFPTLSIIYSYIENKPLSIQSIIITIISMFAILVLSIFNSQKRYNLIVSERNLEYEKNHNMILQSLVDSLRTFKHDYNNTLSTLYGYVQLNDIDSLKRVFKEILEESRQISSLDKLNPNLIKDPNIFGILTAKYQECLKKNIMMNIDIYAEIDNVAIKMYDLTRVLGIFLDNAIEAAAGSKGRKINLIIDEKNNEITIEVSNTYKDDSIESIERIFEKGISSKGKNRGLGLYKVKEIIKKNPRVELKTTKSNEMFMQKLIIQKHLGALHEAPAHLDY